MPRAPQPVREYACALIAGQTVLATGGGWRLLRVVGGYLCGATPPYCSKTRDRQLPRAAHSLRYNAHLDFAMIQYSDISWERMLRAVEKVRERLMRAAHALESANVPYAVVGGNAVAAWVSRVDEAAVRNTQDVDVLLRRSDLESAKSALGAAGFVYRHSKGLDMFLDGPAAKARDAVHIVFAGEKVRPADLQPTPDLQNAEPAQPFRLIALDALVTMKLTAFRDKDRVHLRDLLEVGLIDAAWCDRLPPALADRLRQLINSPDD